MKLYDNHHEGVYRFLRVKLPSDQLAQDLTAEAFTKTWDMIMRDPSNYPKNAKAYVYKVAYNTLKDYYRIKDREVAVGEDEVMGYLDNQNEEDNSRIPEVALAMDTDKEMERVRLAMQDMSDYSAELITLRYLEEMSNSEIADILDKSEGAVRTGISRAMAELKEKLDK